MLPNYDILGTKFIAGIKGQINTNDKELSKNIDNLTDTIKELKNMVMLVNHARLSCREAARLSLLFIQVVSLTENRLYLFK